MSASSLTRFLLPVLMATGVAACDTDKVRIATVHPSTAEGPLKVVTTLQCPDIEGSLTRRGSADPSGTSCTYSGPRGAEVVLHLVKLDDKTTKQALAPFEEAANQAIPGAAVRIDAREGASDDSSAEVIAPGVNIRTHGDQASVRLPGLQVETQGDKASVRIGGFNIAARKTTEQTAEAPTNAAEAAAATPVQQAPSDHATRVTYLLVSNSRDTSPYRQVGFEARGPVGGPLVVATFRTKDTDDKVIKDAAKLVTLNVGQ